MATDAESVISSFDLEEMNQAKTIDFLMQLLKLLLPKSYWNNSGSPKPSRFYYPRTSPLVFIDDLLENLEELLVQDTAISTRPLNFFVSRVQKKLLFWNSRLQEISEQRNNTSYLKDLTYSITNLAYEVEYALDSFLAGDFPIWKSMFWLLNVFKQFEQVESQRTNDDDVVGFEMETRQILGVLVKGPRQLLQISIVGAPGQGKTTLANKLFNHPSIVEYFDTRAWCCVSQIYNKRELLLELLSNLSEIDADILGMDDEELSALLLQCLEGWRFLVVLDDMWNTEAWLDLRRFFPDNFNGSRIVITTRMQELALFDSFNPTLQTVSPLSGDECWELLKKKLFHDENCPHELERVGREIAEKCKGLPLSVISTVQLLFKMEKTVDRWEEIAKTLRSHILGDAKSQSRGVLEFSYKNLPDRLKPCFLHFGVFLENKEISVSKLIRLWIAEGFVENDGIKSLEEVAKEYLMDLIGRSLVTAGHKKVYGEVKYCHLDDLLYEFCLTKAREDNFLQLINGYDKLFHSSHDTLNYNHGSSLYSSTPIIYHQCRLRIHSKRNHFIMLKPFGPFMQSLLFSAASDTSPSYSYDISFIFHNFKFLKTLDFEGINIGDSLKEIDVLVLLRYLAVQSYAELIPSSIVNLWNLETFIFKGLRSAVEVPDSIWDMTKLRHVHINDSASFDIEPHRLEASSTILENLQTFSTPILAYGDDAEKIMRRLRGIKKLKCIFLDSWDDARNCNNFPVLDFLDKLVSLKVLYDGGRIYPCVFSFPSNLRELTLSNFHMPWNEFSQLAKLCNLRVLKLLSNAFKGETWDMEDAYIPQLKILRIEDLDVVTWSANSNKNHFPRLKHLLLNRCKSLVEIPQYFGDVTSLEIIEVMLCNTSVANSARRIHEEQLKSSNLGFKIIIHPTEADFGES